MNGPPDGVANRRINLTRDLRDRQAIGDGHVELDDDLGIEADPEAALAQPERTDQPRNWSATKARHAI